MAASNARFARYLNPLIKALVALGNSGRPQEVCDRIAAELGMADSDRMEAHASGGLKFDNDIAWARLYLVKAGYIDSSRRGVWSLTDKGRASGHLSEDDVAKLIRDVQTQSRSGDSSASIPADELESEVESAAELGAPEYHEQNYRDKVLELLRGLPPSGFERLCQRLLRESGFQRVDVTGRSGDGGIDGIGILQVNAFVSFKVLFQCKRYSGSVSSSAVRDFRGTMTGRADKGLILTTGTFTAGAQAEATRDGAPPLELVDGQELVNLMEKLELGLVARTTYDVDLKFFDEFRGS